MSKKKYSGLTRRTSGLMALEPRFMFDGAAVSDAIQTSTLVDSAVAADAKTVAAVALVQAEQQAQQKVAEFLNKATDQEVFNLFNGGKQQPDSAWAEHLSLLREALNTGNTGIQVVMMEQASQLSAIAAFAANGPDGKPTIFVNPYWAGLLGAQDMTSILVEEIGHWMDTVLNPDADTQGDEGQSLADAVMGTATQVSRNSSPTDSGWVTVDGVNYQVEFASFNFVNAYEMVYDLDNDTATGTIDASDIDVSERWADKEQNLHYFNSSTSLGVVRISDGTNGQSFSGNDVSAISVVVNGTTYYGWISRPIKANGIVRGFYFWTDDRFTSLAAAQADGNQDGDRVVLNNRGFVFVVDQGWFTDQINATKGANTLSINNQKDGNLGSIWVANVGSSSDRVDSALNSVLTPNSAPSAVNDALTVNEDSGTTTISAANGLLKNDTDANSDALTVTTFSVGGVSTAVDPTTGGSYTIANVGTVTINKDGSYSFAPVANYNGSIPPITYTVSDGSSSTTAVLSITVTPVNDRPVATDDVITTSENTPKVLALTDFGTYSDPENSPLAKIQITQLASNGSLQYWNGSAWSAVTINQELTVAQILQGQVRFAPDANESGSNYAILQFKVSDGQNYSASAYTLTVHVTVGNQAPVAVADTKSVAEAGCGVAATNAEGNVLTDGTDDSDPENQVLSVVGVTFNGNTKVVSGATTIKGQYGTLTINPNGNYSYALDNTIAAIDQMNSGATKTETFSYTVSDGTNSTSTTLILTINGTNDDPIAADDSSIFTEGDNQSSGNYGTVTGNALTNDTDVDNNTLSVELGDGTTPPGASDVSLSASSPISAVTIAITQISGSWTAIVPTSPAQPVWLDAAYSNAAVDKLGNQLTVYRNGSGSGATLVFSDNVALYNYENTNLYIKDPGNSNYTKISVDITSATTSASATVSTTASVTGIQAGYTVSGTGVPAGTTVVSVDAANKTITLSQSVNIANATLTFHDPNAISINSSVEEYYSGQYGYLILNQNGSYTYTLTTNLNSDQVVTDQFTYTAKDSANCTDTAVITIRARGVDAPNLANDTLVVAESSGNHLTFNASSVANNSNSVNSNDVNGTTINLGYVKQFTWNGVTTAAGQSATVADVGTLSIATNGTVTFDPVDGYTGLVPLVTYVRYDSTNTGTPTYSATLSITIQASNDPPVAADDTNVVTEDQAVTGNLLINDSDPEKDPIRIDQFTVGGVTTSVSSGSSGSYVIAGVGTIQIYSNGQYSFTPLANYSGTIPAITYRITDGTSTDTADLTLTMSAVNDPPAIDLDGDDSSTVTGSDFKRSYTNGGAAVGIADSDTAVTDTDDTHMEGAEIKLLNAQSGDVLSFNAATLLSSYGITATSSTAGGIITVSLSGTSSLANYVAAIESITFGSTGSSTLDRALSVKVNDGELNSNVAYTTITVNPDSRPVTVMATVVNEASPYVMFEVTGVEGQWISLVLSNTGTGTSHASMGTDFLPNLQYFNGTSWLDYNGGLVQIPDTGVNNGKMLVRTTVLQDSSWESTVATYESLKLTAKNAAGTANLTTDNTNVQADGTAQIRDDGQGSIFLDTNNGTNNALAPNVSGNTGYPAYLDDDRPVTVNNIAVNEASPWAMFTVTGYANQVVSLTLIDGTAKVGDGNPADGSEDYSPNLQYWNGSAWTDYNGTSVTLTGSTLLVRTAVHQDTLFEGQHTFGLGVTKLSSNTTVYGAASIYDDGTGSIYAFDNVNDGTATITTGPGAGFDDDRTLTINSPLVNEASNYVVFTLTGNSGQTVSLQLQDDSSNGTVSGKANILENQTLKIWNGLDWVNYDANNLPTFNADGKIFVRVDIIAEQDAPYEGGETFKLNATLTGTSTAVTGVATIIDDGTGVKFPGTFTNGSPNTDSTSLDDDRSAALSVTGGRYNEGSPRAVFTVNATAGQVLTLDVLDAADTGNAPTGDNEGKPNDSLDTAPIYYSLDGGATWQLYNGTPITAGSVPVLVAVDITNERDDVYEGEEQFKLVVTSGGQTASAFGTIVDDGTGTVYPPNAPNPDPDAPKDDDRPVRVNNIEVNENSPWGVFRVNGTAGQSVTLALQNDNDPNTANAVLGTDTGTQLQYFNGTSWVNYTGAVTLPAGGELLVRVAINDDVPYEGPETFQLAVTPSGGNAVYGTATILDDGTGSIYPDNTTGNPDPDAVKDDDRPVKVNNILVNEASPYAVFTVTGTGTQGVVLSLQNDNKLDTADAKLDVDTGNPQTSGRPLQYFNGSNWVDYTPGSTVNLINGQLLVRTAIVNDTPYEGPEIFQLNVTPSGGSAVQGNATILDDGTGNIYPDNTTGNPDPDAVKNDDRPLRVNNIEVNENSPWGVFRVNGTAGQSVTLALQNDNDPNTANAVLGTDTAAQLQYFNGTSWVNYTGAVTLPAGGELLVRVAINDDDPYEGPETFQLSVTPSGGNAVYGTATILDDGTGSIYPDNTTGNPDLDAAKDDDRPVRVNNIEVNENSPWGVFRVNGTAGQTVTLALQNDNDPNTANAVLGADTGTQLQYFNGTSWVNYTGAVTLPAGGELLVRVAINDDDPYEGPETFQLSVTPSGGNAVYGTATILDDGTGSIYPDNTTGNPDPDAVKDDDRPVKVNNILVNEASPYAVFTVTGTGTQGVVLSLQNDNKPDTADAKLDVDTGNPQTSGRPLQYFNGSNWVDYTPGSTVNLINGQLLVRTAIVNDVPYEGAETFQLRAAPSGGLAAYGTATILDDGTGDIHPDNTNGATDPRAAKNDDRPVAAVPPPMPPAPPMGPPAAPAELAPLPPLTTPLQSFASAITPLAPALVPVDPPLAMLDAVTSGSGYQIPVSESAAPGLNLYQGITDQFIQSTDTTTKVSLPFDAFIHSNKDAVIKLEAKQADNSKLPAWVQFDPVSGVFEVTPPKGFKGKLDLKVVARDDDGREAVAIFQMFIGEQQVNRPQSRDSFSDKLRMAGKRPITLVRVTDAGHKVVVREAMPAKVRAG